MGFVKDTFDAITGKSGQRASRDAARQQAESTDKALELTRETRDIARSDLQPFREVGEGTLGRLGKLVTDPRAQVDFIENNPFFDALLSRSRGDIFKNRAARGKLGSGGTLEALDENVLRLGPALLDTETNRLLNLANLGQASAAGQANVSQRAGTQGADLLTQQGNALAAGTVGAANARTQGVNNLLDIAGRFF